MPSWTSLISASRTPGVSSLVVGEPACDNTASWAPSVSVAAVVAEDVDLVIRLSMVLRAGGTKTRIRLLSIEI